VTPEEKHARFERALKAFSRRVRRETGIGLSAALLYSECEEGSTYFFCSHSVEAAKIERLMILSLEQSQGQRLQSIEKQEALPIQ